MKFNKKYLINDFDIFCLPLVCPKDRVGPPVGPIDVRLEEGNGERVREVFVPAQNLAVVFTFVSRGVNGVRST